MLFRSGLPLSENMKDSLLVLHSPMNYTEYMEKTAGYTRWHSLIWDNCSPVPTWLTHITESSTDDEAATPEAVTAGTSSSSSTTGTGTGRTDLVTEALAKALLLMAEKTEKAVKK